MAGVFAIRHALAYPLSLLSALIVARMYEPLDLGIFALLSFVATLPALLGDLGLTGAFIRQKDDPDGGPLAAAASLQLWIAALALPPILIGAVVGGSRFGYPAALPVVLVLYLPVILTSLTLRANVMIWRRLDFARLAALETAQQLLYLALLATGGATHLGAGGLAIATSLSQVLRQVVTLWWYPIRPAAVPRRRHLSEHLGVGLPLKIAGIVNGLREGLVSWLGVPLFGPMGVGYLRWSLDITAKVGISLVNAVDQVVFPTVSLLQQDWAALSGLIGKACRYNIILIGTLLALMAGLAEPAISAVFGTRWLPATVPLQLFAAFTLGEAILVPLHNTVQVLRPTTATLMLAMLRFGVTAALVLATSSWLDLLSIPVTQVIAATGMIVALHWLLPRELKPILWSDLLLPLVVAASAFGPSWLVARQLAAWPALFVGLVAGVLASVLVFRLLGGRALWTELLRDLAQLAPRRAEQLAPAG